MKGKKNKQVNIYLQYVSRTLGLYYGSSKKKNVLCDGSTGQRISVFPDRESNVGCSGENAKS